jgi:DNA-binding Xre family transcriptional regulator
MKYEDAFRHGLKAYMEQNLVKQSALAEKAGIKQDAFSKLLNTKRRIFGEEIMSICAALGLNVCDIISHANDNITA